MAVFKCKMCGGSLELLNSDSGIATCDYCGSVQTIPQKSDDVIANLFNRANNLRIKCEFDKAAQVYEKILNEDNNEAEAHWGLLLCKYGIEYVEDPKTRKRIPTCHRTQFESILTNVDYLATLANSDGNKKDIYKSQAEEISALQKDILAIVSKEKPFDVFICYKETDANGKRTVDSALANDIYYQLTQEGLKVFYAAITLEDKLGQEYEPYIFSALNSAKVMLVIGTKPEHFEAVWVKNEWSRYLKLMKTDRSKLLIPCYRDMDAYDLPEEFSHIQAQDMAKIGFINDVVRGIKKLVAEPEKEKTRSETVSVSPVAETNTSPLLERAFMFLEDSDWQSADEYCEKVLDIEPKNAEAYLGKLMAELRVRKNENLKDYPKPFEENSNYEKILRFGNNKLKQELESYIKFIKERNEKARLEELYTQATIAIKRATTEKEYKDAANLFDDIINYKDSADLKDDCLKKAEDTGKDEILTKAKNAMKKLYVIDQEEAIKLLKSIPNWKNADELIDICLKNIEEIKANAERNRIKAEEKARKRKKLSIIVTSISTLLIVFSIILSTFILPTIKLNKAMEMLSVKDYDSAYALLEELGKFNTIKESKYVRAKEMMTNGEFKTALMIFEQISGYKDSSTLSTNIYLKANPHLSKAKIGQYILLGSYEQDNNLSNGKEAIEWLVVDKKDNRILVVSKYALDCQKYNETYEDVTWQTCTLRKWLNNDFFNNAFTSVEKTFVPISTLIPDTSLYYNTNPGSESKDKVFIFNISETQKYFTSDEERECCPTKYAQEHGSYMSEYNTCWWWLRSPGYSQQDAAKVNCYGGISEYGNDVNYTANAVRPAMWLEF